jgi:hypothetical protein
MKPRDRKKGISLQELSGCLFFVLVLAMLAGCSGLSISGSVGLDDEVGAGGLPESTGEYGKFIVYRVANGAIKTLSADSSHHYNIWYHVTDLNYNPIPDYQLVNEFVYNSDHCGDGWMDAPVGGPYALDPGQSIYYKDSPSERCGRQQRRSSDHPEALTVDNQLIMYYTNYPTKNLRNPNPPYDYISCPCFGGPGNCPLVSAGNVADGFIPSNCSPLDANYDFPDAPDPSNGHATIGNLNCQVQLLLSTPANKAANCGTSTPDRDWLRIPMSQYGYSHNVPLKIRMFFDQMNMRGSRVVKLSLYETAAGAVPGASDKPVAITRFGFDYSRQRDPVLGYILKPDHDYWVEVADWTTLQGATPANDLLTMIYFESTPALPVEFDPSSAIFRATVLPARSGNPDLNNGPYFEPDDVTTLVEDLYPDCDGIPDSGDEGDWGMYEICPVEGSGKVSGNDKIGLKDGVLEYWEVDNKSNIDDGEVFSGIPTNLSSMGYEAPSVIQVGDVLWMFISTGSGIFQLSSLDGHVGLQWDMSNIYNNRPSLLPRSLDPNAPGDPEAPVVSSGRYGICDTDAQGDDIQVTPKGKGYKDSVCVTFGGDGVLDSYAMIDEYSNNVINSGPDGVINTWFFPSCVSYQPPIYSGQELKTEGIGNPDLMCGDSVPGADDNSAYLLGDDEWATSAIGVNPPEYWRRQHCDPLSIGEHFQQCALGKSNTWMITAGKDNVLNTVQERLSGDDYFCHYGDVVGICPGGNGVFDQPRVEEILSILRAAPQGGDYFCVISPAGGLEYARFKFGSTYQLQHKNLVPGSEQVISYNIALYDYMNFSSDNPRLTRGVDYQIDYVNGQITWLGTNWLTPVFGSGDPKKDALIVYYRYNGLQTGLCTSTGHIDTAYNFFLDYKLSDHILAGPPVDYPAPLAGLVGKARGDANGLGDVQVGIAGGSTISWDPAQFRFVCSGTDCPISPGSDNTLDAAWLRDADASGYSLPLQPWVIPNRYDMFGQFDDWFCPIDGQVALCPGGNGYFQIYRLYAKEEMKRYKGVDDVLTNFKDPHNPCYNLELVEERSHFYKNDESIYILYAYQGLMGDDRIVWDEGTGQFVLTTGLNGINQSCASSKDDELISRNKGQPYQYIINAGANLKMDTPALQDSLKSIEIEGEEPLLKIVSGDDGICNTFRINDDHAEIFFGTGAPDYPCVKAGPNGYADTKAQGNDSQLYLQGEKTGFDAFGIDTPEVVADGNKLYLYYTGLGWKNIPDQVPPDRDALASNGECKRPGLDNKWGNLSFQYATTTDNVRERTFYTRGGDFNGAVYSALDDNQGVLLAPRIGVATSTIERLNANPSDWDRVLDPVVDVGRVCYGALAGGLGSISLGGASISEGLDVPPSFNYFGSFSPDVLVKYEGDQPIFLMWLSGIYATKNDAPAGSNDEFAGIWKPEYQIGLARSIDGKHFDVANDINPLMVSGDMMLDLNIILGDNTQKFSYLNPTVFPGAEDESYGMIFKMNKIIQNWPTSGNSYPETNLLADQEWLGFGIRNGFIYSGGIMGMLSCGLNPGQVHGTQTIVQVGASLIILMPVAGLLYWRLRGKSRRQKHN